MEQPNALETLYRRRLVFINDSSYESKRIDSQTQESVITIEEYSSSFKLDANLCDVLIRKWYRWKQ